MVWHEDAEQLESHLLKLKQCLETNSFLINAKKSMIIADKNQLRQATEMLEAQSSSLEDRNSTSAPTIMDIPLVDQGKYLGVIVSYDRKHVKKIITSKLAAQATKMWGKLTMCLPQVQNIMISAYIKSLLIYHCTPLMFTGLIKS